MDCRGSRLLRIPLRLSGRLCHVIAVYAPTFRASDVEKYTFYAQLGELAAQCKAQEELIILGDFNARVGTSSEDVGDADGLGGPEGIVGRFGLPELNDNGRLLLDFCRGQRGRPFRIMSTYYNHTQYGTWQHQRTKLWHQIDHVIASAKSAQLFTDVRVMPGIDVDNHRLLSLRLRILRLCKHPFGRSRPVRADCRLPRLNVTVLQDDSSRNLFNDGLLDLVQEDLVSDLGLWQYAVRRVGAQVCGDVQTQRRPQWQRDNADELRSL